MPEPAFTFVDLFAGIGGFHHALAAFGGQCVLACDIDAKCREVYAATFPQMRPDQIIGDIRSLTLNEDGTDRPVEELAALIPDHDVLCAGFPCQPFSKSGAQRGTLDTTRGTLFFDIVSIVQAKKPKFLILENVRNLAGPRHVQTWQTIIDVLQNEGYLVDEVPYILSPHRIEPALGGCPQSRERVFIAAIRSDVSVVETFRPADPSPDWDPNRWNVEDFLDDDDSIAGLDKFLLREDETAWLDAWQVFVQGIDAPSLPGFPIWVDAFNPTVDIADGTPAWKADFLRKNSAFYLKHRTFIDDWLTRSWKVGQTYRVQDFPPSRRKFEWQARTAQPTRAQRNLWQLTIHLRPSGVRVKPATYLPALVAITQTSIIGSRRRRITPAEAARLQGLPDGMFARAGVDDVVAYKQAGNGVNVAAVTHVATQLFAAGGEPWVVQR